MADIIELFTTPENGYSEDLNDFIVSELQLPSKEHFIILKRSIDARKKNIRILLRIEYDKAVKIKIPASVVLDQTIQTNKKIHIIGAGPAGLFAGLKAIENGFSPIIYERGKDVKSRRRDLATINKEHIVNPESNYCFGEGGAGTYSDGKLYTRSKKRGDVREVLQKLVHFGAPENILFDAHPHIGTNKLPQIIENIRNAIIDGGGSIQFNAKLTDVFIQNNAIKGFEINRKQKIETTHLILATGHSARDVFELLHERKVGLEFKPFAIGVRIEHQQKLIDKIQYKTASRGEFLPPSSYRLVSQINGRGVYSFCMCPGGIIAPCATSQEEVVTNGWSPSKRNNPWANSGLVTEVRYTDIPEFHKFGPLAGMEFQRSIEYACWKAGGESQVVPAQRMVDFTKNIPSSTLPESSYIPGKKSVNLNSVLPDFISESLRKAILDFGSSMKGYLTNEAVLHAPESRTSSPVRIPRDKTTMQHITIHGLYPCAEGAGYAGGIISAAVDGKNCITALSAVNN
ncbi:FAD-binding protein [Flavobacteriales bacterium]|nr:FAD-binding protein [Flavobacteriales bacterium]